MPAGHRMMRGNLMHSHSLCLKKQSVTVLVLLVALMLSTSRPVLAQQNESGNRSPVAAYEETFPKEAPAAGGMKLEELISLSLQQNPRLARIAFEVEAARGRAVQAGLYPNPTVSLTWDELGDKTGPS